MNKTQVISASALILNLGMAGLLPAQVDASDRMVRQQDSHRMANQYDRHLKESREQHRRHGLGLSTNKPHNVYPPRFIVPAYEKNPLHHKHLHKRYKPHRHTAGFVSPHKSWRKQHTRWDRYTSYARNDVGHTRAYNGYRQQHQERYYRNGYQYSGRYRHSRHQSTVRQHNNRYSYQSFR